jgi:hypothetical protein
MDTIHTNLEFEFDIKPYDNILEDLTKFTFDIYFSTNCERFFVLHCITSLHALKQILPYLNENQRNLAISYYWKSLVYAYVIENKPSIKKFEKINFNTTWNEVIENAINQNEEHIMKLVQICNKRMMEFGDNDNYLLYIAHKTSKLEKFKF